MTTLQDKIDFALNSERQINKDVELAILLQWRINKAIQELREEIKTLEHDLIECKHLGYCEVNATIRKVLSLIGEKK